MRIQMPEIFPKILAKGTINDDSVVATSFFVMQKFDVDMITYLQSYTGVEHAKKVVSIIM